MFLKIDTSMLKEAMTKYPHGKTIFEALSGTITSFNDYVTEVNAKVASGIITIGAAQSSISAQTTALFNTLSANFTVLWNAELASLEVFKSGLNASLAAKANIAQEAWILPTLGNGWVDYGITYNKASYYKDDFGVVHLQGLIKGGTIGVAAFTLPDGYKPQKDIFSPSVSNLLYGLVYITATGLVMPYSGSNVSYSLEGINFRV